MDTYYGEIEESAKNLSKARKEVMEVVARTRALVGAKTRMVREDVAVGPSKVCQNHQLQLSKRPVFEHGKERNPRTSYTGFYKLLDVGRVNKIVLGEAKRQQSITWTARTRSLTYLPYDERIAKKILQPRPHSRGEFIEISHPVGIRFGGSSATEF